MPPHASPISDAAARHKAAAARREANAIRQARAEDKRQRRAQMHGFHLSDYPREDSDFYPTPPILAAGLAVGLSSATMFRLSLTRRHEHQLMRIVYTEMV